eukprot:XP_001699191.1 predicted protein [Chlamydomonas reinhardtii]
MATPPGATPDDRDAMHTDYGCYGPSDEQADTESEEFGWADELLDGQIDDGFRGFEALPNDDGSAAVGTDGEESFNVALPAERQSPHSPPAAMFAEAVGAKVSMICSDAPPSSPAASSCASLDSLYRHWLLAATGEPPAADASVVVSLADGGVGDTATSANTNSGDQEAHSSAQAAVSHDMELDPIPMAYLQQPSFDGWPHASGAAAIEADTMSEDTIAEIDDDALMRGLPGSDDTAFWLMVDDVLPNDDGGSAAVGTADGEESFNAAPPAERQSPHSPPAAMFAEAVGAKVSMICSDAPPSSPAASSCASLDSLYRHWLLAATGEPPAADASVVVSLADGGVGDTATSANTNSGDQEAHSSAQAAVSHDMELDPIPMAYLQQPSDVTLAPHAAAASSSDIGIAKKPQSIDKDLAASHDKLQQLAEGTVLWNHIGSMAHVLPPHFRVMAGMVSAQLLEGNQANAVLASREIQQQVLAAHQLAKDPAAATDLLQTQALWKLLITLITSRNLVGSLPASATAAAASASAACPAESAAVACNEAGSPDSEATAPPSGGVLAAAQQHAAGRKRKAPSSGADKAVPPPPMEVVAAADETEEEVAPPAAKRPRIEASSMQKALERGRPQAGPFRVMFACPCGKELRDHMATVSAKGAVTFGHLCGGDRYERNAKVAKAEEEMRNHGVIKVVKQQKGK